MTWEPLTMPVSFRRHLEAMIASRETVIKQRERANAEDRAFIQRAKDRLAELDREDRHDERRR